MKLDFYIPPRFERRIKNNAIKTEFDEIWEWMGRYQMTGWYYYLGSTDLDRVTEKAKKMDMNQVDYVLSIGTGGSYQGVDMLLQFSPHQEKFIFIGPSLDPDEIAAIMKKIEGKRIGVNLISKSGGTLEILIFINLFRPFLEQAQWMCLITSNPSFVSFIQEHFKKPEIFDFEIAKDIGGRFSIASSMGLVVATQGGLNFDDFSAQFLAARKEMEAGENLLPFERGIARYLLFTDGKILENLATNSKKIMPTLQWARQLWAESNGKEYKSMFVSTGFYPEDAHSVGQIWKEGPRKVTETYFVVEQNHDIVFDTSLSIKDLKIQVNSLNQINLAFSEAMIEDRFECGIPVTVYRLPKMDLATWGRLAFNEMAAVVVEAYLLGVNPFNQPGVESYKAKVKDRIL